MKTVNIIFKPGKIDFDLAETINEYEDCDQFCEFQIQVNELPRVGDMLRFENNTTLPDIKIFRNPIKNNVLKNYVVGDTIWAKVFEVERCIVNGILDSEINIQVFVEPWELLHIFNEAFPKHFLIFKDLYFEAFERNIKYNGKIFKIASRLYDDNTIAINEKGSKENIYVNINDLNLKSVSI